ncbi:sister chromatid cohesion protein DCC1 isoform X1 [Acinonyx jubatus]|uniref:Sister chromatid cohesion protein DCC1 n=2 Tax=Felinae TaxID=338152 RepID=A0A6J0A6H0_ACIJB|nr:sister chromatid cohesion protein DCC1 isoform X1 [Acinonyx jubatus]
MKDLENYARRVLITRPGPGGKLDCFAGEEAGVLTGNRRRSSGRGGRGLRVAPRGVAAQLPLGPAEAAPRQPGFPPAARVLPPVSGRGGDRAATAFGPPRRHAPPRKHAPCRLGALLKVSSLALVRFAGSRLLAEGVLSSAPTGPSGTRWEPRGRTAMRTREEVDATLQIAKLNAAELLPAVHCLGFGPGAGAAAGDFCLLELEPSLCQQLEAGHSLVIRGDKDEQAVLCSKDKTYDLKIADTSNMLLFIPGCKTPDQLKAEETHCNIIHTEIFGFSNNYWELRRCRPKLKKLKKLLMEDAYEGPDSQKEKDSNQSKYTTEDLLNQIQASEEEIMAQLQVLNACEIEGYWRILDFDYEMKLLNHITQLVDSESWSFGKVPLNMCLQELGPLEPEEMIEHCLKCYGKKYIEEGEVYFELSADKICRATAQMLLQNAVKFNLAEFQEVWQQSVPEGMITTLDQLKGLALVDRQSRPEIIFLLKVDDLPEDNQERFNSLFSLREKWTEEDIAPYIQDLCGEKQTIGTLLTKYSRSSIQNGVKVYNSRRPIS